MSEQNRALAIRWMKEVWNDRREATIAELLAEDALGHLEGVETRGRAEFEVARASLLAAFPDLRITVEETAADGDHVVARWSVTGTHLGDGLGFAASGRVTRFRGMTWFRFEKGRIAEGWDAWNLGAVIEELRTRPRGERDKAAG
jgi:steroid delta-isomerase-like uncharacterized protein